MSVTTAVPAAETTPAGSHRRGVVLQVAGAFVFSLAGLFTRVIVADAPTLLFWRGIFAALSMVAAIGWLHRGHAIATWRQLDWFGVLVAACTAGAMTSFIWALRLTSVASVSVIYATAPLVTAALGWLLFRTRSGWPALAAGAATAVGVAVMVSGPVAAGHLAGDGLAVVMTLLSAALMILLRVRAAPMLPAMGLGALLTAILALPWAAPLQITPHDLLFSALFGMTQLGLGLVLMTLGARMVSATEIALYGALEVPLAPLWVWIGFAETPGPRTVIGGAIVLSAVVAFIALQRGEADG